MSDFKGGDLDGMRQLKSRLDNAQKSLTTSAASIAKQINGVDWRGKDAQQFKDNTVKSIKTQLGEAASILSTASGKLNADIAQQESTSNRL